MSLINVHLSRQDTSRSWGFRLRGGIDQGVQLFVEQANPKGRAVHQGLRQGDRIYYICGTDVTGMTHGQVKGEILRAGNDLELSVLREEGASSPVPAPVSAPAGAVERVQVCEEPTLKIGGPTYKDVQPKTYQIVNDQLNQCQDNSQQAGMKPSSIFDRKRQERSAYLKSQGTTIQKAFGES